jgi:hypothetical protein
MLSINDGHHNIFSEFLVGHLNVLNSGVEYSGTSTDQSHTKMNVVIKGGEDSVGLTEGDNALTVAVPEIVHMLNGFEMCFVERTHDSKHREIHSAQVRFKTDVNMLLEIFEHQFIQ